MDYYLHIDFFMIVLQFYWHYHVFEKLMRL